jgi:hypothetical protein
MRRGHYYLFVAVQTTAAVLCTALFVLAEQPTMLHRAAAIFAWVALAVIGWMAE